MDVLLIKVHNNLKQTAEEYLLWHAMGQKIEL